jgi:N-acetylglucosamine kinase-like BadF-type ATPase
MPSVNQKRYVIGIDAGASNTEVVVSPLPCKWESLKNLQIRNFSPINYNVLGKQATLIRLTVIIKQFTRKIGINNVAMIIAGLAGARNKNDGDKISKSLQKSLKVKNIEILPDTEIALASVFDKNERNCGILIAGTGSILYYRDGQGKIRRIGGWGRILGDEGSGYWIGKEALNRLTGFYDGLCRQTKLNDVLGQNYGINAATLIQKIYHENFEISRIAKNVFDCAETGDKVSVSIIKEAAEHLANHLSVFKNKKMRIALTGSLFSKEYLLGKYFRKLVRINFPNIEFIKPGVKPAWGAVKMALEKIQL